MTFDFQLARWLTSRNVDLSPPNAGSYLKRMSIEFVPTLISAARNHARACIHSSQVRRMTELDTHALWALRLVEPRPATLLNHTQSK